MQARARGKGSTVLIKYDYPRKTSVVDSHRRIRIQKLRSMRRYPDPIPDPEPEISWKKLVKFCSWFARIQIHNTEYCPYSTSSMFLKLELELLFTGFETIFTEKMGNCFSAQMRNVTSYGTKHGQINYTDTKAKCRHLKNLSVKGLRCGCLSVWGPLPYYNPLPPPPLHFVYV
jgi:hypothetical protein